jgi:predicted AAA+ superfamily ATPase
LPIGATSWFYRTSAGAEIDLVIELGPKKRIAIEIKRSMAPVLSKGFYLGCEDIKATQRFIVYPGSDRYPATTDVTVLSLIDMMKELRSAK